MFTKKTKRFKVKEEQTIGSATLQIVVDTTTGVNYILTKGVDGYSITPLLDAQGAVVIDE